MFDHPIPPISGRYKTKTKGRFFYQEGDLNKVVFRVVKGRVKLSKQGVPIQRNIILDFVYPSEFFGIADFFTASKHRRCSAIAMDSEVVVEVISIATFEDYIFNHPTQLTSIVLQLIKREEDTWVRFYELQIGTVHERVYKGIKKIAAERGKVTDQGIEIKHISQSELASYLGVFRQSINATFNKLKKEGKIKYDRKKFLLLQY